jgi:hypothetical protein
MKLFVEITSIVKNRNANLIPASELSSRVGFRSVYMFDEQDAEIIRFNGHSRGFKYFNLYSDCLFVDIDMKTKDDAKRAVEDIKRLVARKIRFDLYDSGNRSYHLHIPHPLKNSRHLPYNHARILNELGFKYDNTLYRPNSLYRLPGTVHAKSVEGRCKELLKSYNGELLDFEIIPEPIKEFKSESFDSTLFLDTVLYSLWEFSHIQPENRYMSTFAMALKLFDAGLSSDTVLDLLMRANDCWPEPNDECEVERAVQGAMERINN